MKIETRNFGALEIDEKEIITFCTGIYGFEEYKEYVLLYDDDIGLPFMWLQSVKAKDVCFILTDAETVGITDYAPHLSAETRIELKLYGDDEPVFRLITVVPEHFIDATVNLKSPVVLNPKNKLASQVILDENYPIKARLVPQTEGAK
ncbi:MAG: flagellar assembly protein FliW [Hydrogenoanaerobacterium sp.]